MFPNTKIGMQHADGVVRLAGSLLHTVQKKDMSPAEVIILRAEHGSDAVVELEKTVADFTTPGEELERLASIYGEKKVAEAFPGARPHVPMTFSEIGIRINEETRKTRMLKEARDISNSEDDGREDIPDSEVEGQEDYTELLGNIPGAAA